ncbi:MAG: cell division protein FtsL [Myxococcales bacterium]|nr:cell division protein FtsL [Myxococcales bacterium]MCB9650736.1 cell division protein FtsL [Deltaproteobacteria bacterium]
MFRRLLDMAQGKAPMGPVGTAILVAGPVVAAALFYVWTHVTTVRLGYALSKAGESHRQLLEENRALRIEAAALKSPDRLEKLGQERYGLGAPRTEQVVRVAGRSK